jgi:formiminotetrahydrofolate cyclodeaminase
LANAALHSALINVNINLKFIKETNYVATWSAKRDALLAEAAIAYTAAHTACAATLGVAL